MNEIAEIKKQHFIRLVRQLAGLRDLQFDHDMAPAIVESAQEVVALNLPSNSVRAAAIFVDWRYGFPPDQDSFTPPKWVGAKKLLPEGERGSLVCARLADVSSLTEKDVVVLVEDIPAHGLYAGTAGMIKECPDADDPDARYLVEFGDPANCTSQEVEISLASIRRPRPGDLIENYCL
jgi:hypothetical protein